MSIEWQYMWKLLYKLYNMLCKGFFPLPWPSHREGLLKLFRIGWKGMDYWGISLRHLLLVYRSFQNKCAEIILWPSWGHGSRVIITSLWAHHSLGALLQNLTSERFVWTVGLVDLTSGRALQFVIIRVSHVALKVQDKNFLWRLSF